jgi:ATP-binding protein involved in chromosome partitioning
VELDPEIRKGGDTGHPVALAGEDYPHAKSFYQFARRVVAGLEDLRSRIPEPVIRIQ